VNNIPLGLCTRLQPVLILVMATAWPVAAQFTDDFSDGDFTNNPTWSGDTSQFVVSNGKLRSNGPNLANQKLFLQTTNAKMDDAEWSFLIDLGFNPTATTFVRVYLVSNQSNLKGPVNGYFVQIGQTNADSVKLFRQDGLTTTEIFSGSKSLGTGNIKVRIRVRRTATGSWEIHSDATGGTNYTPEGPAIIDNTYEMTTNFGVYCEYSTASRFNLYHFDDFYVGDILYDTEPPAIVSVTPQSVTELEVLFNENVDPVTAQTASNYAVNNSVGQAASAFLQPDERTVKLTFSNNFPNGVTSQLTVSKVEDGAGNAITVTHADFFFFEPLPVQHKDVIFTELFPDPSPVIGLPEAEFVELYNRSANPVSLAGWKFSDPSSTATLPAYILMPGSYVIITPNASASALSSFGSVIGVSNFPTLNNGGDELVLRDATNQVIDAVNYTDAWYKDDDKRQGGWTLELIDLDNICAESENWVASEHPSGGTPGQQNSVKASKPDVTGPRLLSAIPVSPTQLKLVFDEKLQDEIPLPDYFDLLPPIAVTSVSFISIRFRELLLELSSSLQPGQVYSVTVASIRDCSGNLVQENSRTVTFGFPEPAGVMDVVINEILFNPKPFGVDFLEVHNRSPKYINLKNWNIGNYENETAINLRPITTDDFLLPPGSIMAFTVDPLTIKSHYTSANLATILKVSSLPAFPDNAGSASLLNENGLVIDHFRYSRDYHSVFLRDKEGVSLERIYPEAPSNDPNNWKSAASTVGFATPGYRNSNALQGEPLSEQVKIDPEIFVPVFGQPDFTEIKYNFDQGGRMANIKILDQQGREIKRIANNELLATDGFFRWDGDRDDGAKARPGYYVVWFEVFDTSGRVDTFRKRVVVAARY
jgi:hypothetical protein